MPFTYPTSPHSRRHLPRGYTNVEGYRPWLRDEFVFRCVYCLCRERWIPDEGTQYFAIDHLRAKSTHPDMRFNYENLVYACIRCNTAKGTTELVPDPCAVAYGALIEVDANGQVRPLSREGRRFIRIFRLDSDRRAEYRRDIIDSLRRGKTDLLSFPHDLPDLKRVHPPGGNERPGGGR